MTTQSSSQDANFTWQRALQEAGLGLECNRGFVPVSVSLTPWVLPRSYWNMALATARALSHLQRQLCSHPWLESTVRELPDSTLARKLLEAAGIQPGLSATLCPINRQDLMLDTHGNWKLIESNAIAAGMGPYSERLGALLQKQGLTEPEFAPNPATARLADALYRSASELHGSRSPLIVFVVEDREDNIHDHNALATELVRLGARVERRTLAQLSTQARKQDQRLAMPYLGVIDALYFRTGYNLEDYGPTLAVQNERINARASWETCQVVMTPTIHHQLTSNKWVQMRLSQCRVDTLMALGQLSLQEAIVAHLSLRTPQQPFEIEDTAKPGWLLKCQGEGGGQIHQQQPENTSEDTMAGAIWMQAIEPQERTDSFWQVRDGKLNSIGAVTSELGLFHIGEDDHYAGYLVRSKPSDQLECGVHRGHGMIDTVQLI